MATKKTEPKEETTEIGAEGRDETITPSTALDADGKVIRDMNGAAQSTGSVALKPLYTGGDETEEESLRARQQKDYKSLRQKIIDVYK